ncbi:MAG: flagellar hook-length control protein FliK [Rhodocyclales bacterium]|nr:flagellar hook-length control protein FliK [Rhodocyclales bacterium]
MSDPVKIPQLAIQVAKSPRNDESRATPDGAMEAGSTTISFASVLKAKSQSASADGSVSDPGQAAATDRNEAAAELVAAMFAGSGGLARKPITEPTDLADETAGVQAAPDPAATGAANHTGDGFAAGNPPALLTATDSVTVTTTVTGIADPAALPQTLPAPPAIATPIAVPIAPPIAPRTAQIAVAPAPTSVSTELPAQRDNPLPQPAMGITPMARQIAAAQPGPAVVAANSAEGGKSALPAELPEAQGEFRPLLERMSAHADGIAVQAGATAPNLPAGPEPLQVRVATPFNQTGWAREVEQKLAWVVTASRQQADLVLNPPELGRIEVSVVVKGDEVSASFASPHQAVREAIEESLVRLRENLADAGISLGQTHVGRESSRDASFARPEGREGLAHRAGPAAADSERPLSSSVWQTARGRGLVDVFA